MHCSADARDNYNRLLTAKTRTLVPSVIHKQEVLTQYSPRRRDACGEKWRNWKSRQRGTVVTVADIVSILDGDLLPDIIVLV